MWKHRLTPSRVMTDCASLVTSWEAQCCKGRRPYAVREFANKSAASAASLDSVKFQAVIKAALAADLLTAPQTQTIVQKLCKKCKKNVFLVMFVLGRQQGCGNWPARWPLGGNKLCWLQPRSLSLLAAASIPEFSTNVQFPSHECIYIGNYPCIFSQFFRTFFNIFGP